MNREKERELRKMYIERVFGLTLKPKKGFESIRYAVDRKTDAEYIRIKDKRGTSMTIDITGDDLETVMFDICRIIVLSEIGKHEKLMPPDGLIRNREDLLKLAPLFE